jgi:hypothetical protein
MTVETLLTHKVADWSFEIEDLSWIPKSLHIRSTNPNGVLYSWSADFNGDKKDARALRAMLAREMAKQSGDENHPVVLALQPQSIDVGRIDWIEALTKAIEDGYGDLKPPDLYMAWQHTRPESRCKWETGSGVNISIAEVAELAKVSTRTIERFRRKSLDCGFLRRTNENKPAATGRGKAGGPTSEVAEYQLTVPRYRHG